MFINLSKLNPADIKVGTITLGGKTVDFFKVPDGTACDITQGTINAMMVYRVFDGDGWTKLSGTTDICSVVNDVADIVFLPEGTDIGDGTIDSITYVVTKNCDQQKEVLKCINRSLALTSLVSDPGNFDNVIEFKPRSDLRTGDVFRDKDNNTFHMFMDIDGSVMGNICTVDLLSKKSLSMNYNQMFEEGRVTAPIKLETVADLIWNHIHFRDDMPMDAKRGVIARSIIDQQLEGARYFK